MGTRGVSPRNVLSQAAERTDDILKKLSASLIEQLGVKQSEVFGDHTTFFLTGSGGRGEMTAGSDIDGHVVRFGGDLNASHDALILEATKGALGKVGLPELDRGGEFLAMKADSTIVDKLGSKEDDHSDAFTLRMLFLLESRPLVGQAAYDQLFEVVSAAYRGTIAQHTADFLPFFLVNDIIRYWRTVLLNHEDRLRTKKKELQDFGLGGFDLDRVLLAHRRYRSQKLRFPRCLSCFSTLAYVLAIAPDDDDSISIEQDRKMFSLTPIERLERVAIIEPRVEALIDLMVDLYARYLGRTDSDKNEVVQRLEKDADFQRRTSSEGQRFTEEMFKLIQELGQGNRLHRQMLI